MKRSIANFILITAIPLILSGCESIAKGMTEAVLEHKTEDTKKCEATGRPFTGIRQSLISQENGDDNKITKVLMVHGISKHLPGYSTRFRQKLLTELGLDVVSAGHKNISIRHIEFENKDGKLEDLGTLRVTQHSNKERTRNLLFYELTWSQITDPDKEKLAFDNSGEYSFRRAEMNHTFKKFFNSTIPDLMLYRGNGRAKINYAVAQAACWTFVGDWADIPKNGAHVCDIRKNDFSQDILRDDYFFVTHSLGSRITVDTIEYATFLSKDERYSGKNEKKFFDALKQKELTVFMLSNQLPLLQLGRDVPKISGRSEAYCTPNAEHFDDRALKKLNLVAFSDPNDILSYPIPPDYSEKNIDSRMCADVMNVNINVTDIREALGFQFANPAAAHDGYMEDDRVIALVTDGLGREHMNPLIEDRCRWIETTE